MKIAGTSTRPFSRAIYAASIISTAFLFLFLAYVSGFYEQYPDIARYELMIQGKFDQAGEPYASRVLGPLLANLIMRLTDITALKALAVVNAVSFILFFASVSYYLMNNGVKLIDAQVFLITPYSFIIAKYLYVPDAIGLLSCFLLLLFCFYRRSNSMSAILAVLSVLARKTFFVPIGFIILSGVLNKRVLFVAVLIISTMIGVVSIDFLVGENAANRHNMNMMSYYMLKIPVNLFGNVLGIDMYTNTYQWCDNPVVVFDVSNIIFIGDVDKVGFCYPSFLKIVRTLFVYLVILGLWPYIAIFLIVKYYKSRDFRSEDFVVIGAAILLFLLSAGFGRTAERLFIYSYPFLVFAGPALIKFARDSKSWNVVRYGTIAVQSIGIIFFFVS